MRNLSASKIWHLNSRNSPNKVKTNTTWHKNNIVIHAIFEKSVYKISLQIHNHQACPLNVLKLCPAQLSTVNQTWQYFPVPTHPYMFENTSDWSLRRLKCISPTLQALTRSATHHLACKLTGPRRLFGGDAALLQQTASSSAATELLTWCSAGVWVHIADT